jgi:Flp pilus assembly protein TadG
MRRGVGSAVASDYGITRKTLFRRFRGDRRGSTAVEFGLVAVPFFALLFAIFETAIDFYAGQMLQSATWDAARQIMTGQVQAAGAITSAIQFRDQLICPKILGMVTCSKVQVDARVVNQFNAAEVAKPFTGGVFDTSNFQFCPGGPGQIVVVRAVYPMPILTSLFGLTGTTTVNGSRVRILMGVAALQNEPFPPTNPLPGC